ncbi:hypothetical protein [Pyxidicoccus xibeiensis]|uniref:hypothetical protein n=1 Tax=Pyxidicoccus xibeiensis TaxID=2906759 RepID=UPI0020A7B857|nr:hypothetical protein [Pyxidicoccus xibeiensis]MCP3137544.1 hypothetical protein [Pyxidicoccus xibeiensis]
MDVQSPARVPVIELTRPGSPLLERFNVFARVTCNDGRTHLAGPFTVTDAVRAAHVTPLAMDKKYVVEHLTALPSGGWAAIAGRVSTDPAITLYAFWVFRPDGKSVSGDLGLRMSERATGQPLAVHPWVEGDRLVLVTHVPIAPYYLHYRHFWNAVTGERILPDVFSNKPLPAAATTFPPLPAKLTGWRGTWSPTPDAPHLVWVERDRTVGLVNLAE